MSARSSRPSNARTLKQQERAHQIAELLAEGWSHARIAVVVGTDTATVARAAAA